LHLTIPIPLLAACSGTVVDGLYKDGAYTAALRRLDYTLSSVVTSNSGSGMTVVAPVLADGRTRR